MQHRTLDEIKNDLKKGQEIAFLDVRLFEEYTVGHPIISTHAPSDSLDLRLAELVPGRNTPLVFIGDEAAVAHAAAVAAQAGYRDTSTVSGGLQAGWPLFEDINTLAKAFGEFVEHAYGTPSLSPDALAQALARKEPLAVIDCRPEAEYLAGHVPGAIHVPGTDLLAAAPHLAGGGRKLVVHCGGRTRGIVAVQALRDFGLEAEVAVLENGTFGWELAGHALETGPSRPGVEPSPEGQAWAARAAAALAIRFGIGRADRAVLESLRHQSAERSVYLFDLRAAAADRIAGATAISGGQLIQTVDSHIATQNSPVVVIADQDFAAVATAAWLVRLGWRRVLLARPDEALPVFGPAQAGPAAEVPELAAGALAAWLADGRRPPPLILDFSPSHRYVAGHVPGARSLRRHDLGGLLSQQPQPLVLTAADRRLAAAAWGDLPDAWKAQAAVLAGGTAAWQALGQPLAVGPAQILSPTPWLNAQLAATWRTQESALAAFVEAELERFARPDAVSSLDAAKQGYLDWEIGLIDRIGSDGTLRFQAG